MSCTLPDTTHLLCVWHISLNFDKHVRNLVCHENWQKLNHQFWNLTKETDSRSLEHFETEYTAMVDNFKVAAVKRLGSESNEKFQNAKEWLQETLFEKREKWAYRYTWRHFTAGCHSTQRAESTHASIKVVLPYI